MFKRIVITAIVSSLVATGLSTLMQRAVARKREQEIDVQRWEDEGGQPAGAVGPTSRETARAPELRAQSAR